MRIPVHQLTPAADRREVAAHWQPKRPRRIAARAGFWIE